MVKVVEENARQVPRKKLVKRIGAELSIEGQVLNVDIVDFSLTGFGILVDVSHYEFLKKIKENVNVKYQNQLFQGYLCRIEKVLCGLRVGIKLEYPNFNKIKAQISSGNSRVFDKSSLDKIFNDLILKGPECLVNASQISGRGFFYATEFLNKEIVVLKLHESKMGRFKKGKINIQFELFQGFYECSADVINISESEIELKKPSSLTRVFRRETFRISAPDILDDIKVVIQDPIDGVRSRKTFKINSLGEYGIGLIDIDKSLLLPIGYRINIIELGFEGMKPLVFSGKIKNIRWVASLEAYVVGLEMAIDDIDTKKRWDHFIIRCKYPSFLLSSEGDF